MGILFVMSGVAVTILLPLYCICKQTKRLWYLQKAGKSADLFFVKIGKERGT